MIKTHRREKLLNAIVFFAANTLYCGKTKLYRLLYLLDFEHYRNTGRSVTGLEYYAWQIGAVPATLDGELDEPSGDLDQTIRIEAEQLAGSQRLNVVPKGTFNSSHFTKRELDLLQTIATQYSKAAAGDMVAITAKNGPWDRVWRDGSGENALIEYRLILDGLVDRERVESAAREYDETLKRVGAL